ncbi:MAG TPA: sensor histidine kinase [Trebonia sp.]|jgi:signal transduction histidine kinase|nr:sensor histidine kinase [Trebonia sp.]
MGTVTATRSGGGGNRSWIWALPAVPGWLRRAWTDPGGDRRPSTRDIAIAVVITVIAVAASYGEAHPTDPNAYFTGSHHLPHTPNAALLIVVAGGAALAWRRRYPRLVVCLTTAAAVAYSLLGYVNGVMVLLPAVALVTVATRFPVRHSVVWALAVTVVLMAASAANNPLGRESGAFWIIPANNAVALFVGIAIANRNYVHSARIQAARQATLDAQRRIDEERLRIARELHDVVAHTMATITVQAAAATQLLRDRPDEAAESLKAIRAASKDGLRELRAILDVLRTADSADESADPTQPVPGLSRLDDLLAGVRAAGLPVTLTVKGSQRGLPVVTDLSAFRIIQEALTNTLRHAGPASAAVTVDYGEAALCVEVTDTGHGLTDSAAEAAYAAYFIGAALPVPVTVKRDPVSTVSAGTAAAGAASADAGGHGLRGMRERAAAAGGTIDIGPVPAGGFRVAATLPLDAQPAEPAPTQKTEPTQKAAR